MSYQFGKIFVQHVSKTAGTSLLHFIEPSFRHSEVWTSQQFWSRWSTSAELLAQTRHTAQPMLVRTPLHFAESIRLMHGHFREMFRQVMCGDWWAIGTSRSVDERLISSLHHQERDTTMDRRVVDYLAGKPSNHNHVLKGLVAPSHIAFYATTSPRLILWDSDETIGDDVARLGREALANIKRYDYIVDVSTFEKHCAQIKAALRFTNNLGEFNTRKQFQPTAIFSMKDVERLRRNFSLFFKWEDKVYAALKEKSLAVLDKPLESILEAQAAAQKKTILLLPDNSDVSAMSPTVTVGLLGWQSACYRELYVGASLHNIPVSVGSYEGYVWLWSADTDRWRELSIQIDSADSQSTQVILIENPSHHFWLVKLTFSVSVESRVKLLFRQPDSEVKTLWLGAKLYWQRDRV